MPLIQLQAASRRSGGKPARGLPLARALGIALALLCFAAPAGAADDAAHERWIAESRSRLDAEGRRLGKRLEDGITGLQSVSGLLASAHAQAGTLAGGDQPAAFRFLATALGPEPEWMGLPLGVQLLQNGELKAWSGHPLPVPRSDLPLSDTGPRLALRRLGIQQFLTARGQLPGTSDLEWILDLPLARLSAAGDEEALPVLLRPEAGLDLTLLAAAGEDSSVAAAPGAGWGTKWTDLAEIQGLRGEGIAHRWRLEQSGAGVLELELRGPAESSFRLAREANRRLWLGAVAFPLLAIAGFGLRHRMRRSRPEGLSLAWRALIIASLVLGLRGLLILGGIPRCFFDGVEFWTPRPFALQGLGGFFASPGEFLISALAALLVLLLVLRPYLRPEKAAVEAEGDLDAPPGEERAFRVTDLLLLLPALMGPWLGVLAAAAFARHIFRNSAAALIFEQRFLDAEPLGLSIALFFAVAFLIALFLSPAQLAWRRLPAGRRLRFSLSLPLLLVCAWISGVATALALLCILPVAWGFRRATARLTGLVYHLFFIVLAVAILTQDAVERARSEHLRFYLEDAVARQDDDPEIWQSVLIEETLLDMGRSEALRRELDRAERLDPLMALALWQTSGLQELGLEGGLEIYDRRGRRLSRFQWGVDLPERAPRSVQRQDLQDLWLTVEPRESIQSGGRERLLVGEIMLRSPAGLQGSLVLTLVERREGLAGSLANPSWSRHLPPEREGFQAGREEPVIARLQDGRVVDSSAPSLLGGDPLRFPAVKGRWERLKLDGRDFRVALLGGGEYLAAYPETRFLDRLLAFSLRLFLHLTLLFALLVMDLLFSRVRVVRRYLPPLIGTKGWGFQHKLLGAFLLVALVPTVMTGIIAGRQLRRQYEEASQKSSLERALAAQRALESRVRQDAGDLAGSEYVQSFILPDFPPTPRDIGSLEQNWVMIFDAADSLILDESLRNLSPGEARRFLASLPVDRVVYEREGDRLFAGILLPFEVHHRRERLTGHSYYRMRLSEALLDDLTAVVGGDLNLYGGGQLIHSNQAYLFGLGFQPPVLDPKDVEELFFRAAPFHQGVRRAGNLDIGYASLPLQGSDGRPVAVLSSMDFSGLGARRRALEQGNSVVYGMIALLIVGALILGGTLAGLVIGPIRRLQQGTRRLATGDLSFRLAATGRDEIGELVSSFNSMAAGLQDTRRALQDRQRFLESVLENVTSGVMTFGRDGKILSANSAARRLLGISGELEGRVLAELARRPSAGGLDTAPFFERLVEDLGGSATKSREISLDHPEGARSFRVTSTGLGEGRLAFFEDITDLIRSQKLSAWGEMARQVAHEIKNPLTPIKLSVQHVQRAWRDRRGDFDAIFEDSLRTISEQVEILRKIAQEFSLYGRRPDLRLEIVDLTAAAREVLAPYTGSALEILWEDAGRVAVTADAEALRKVILNLVENAREAMGEGGRLEVSCRALEGQGELRLRDHGPGIPLDAMDRLFEPYFSSKTGGTGLGLAICAQLVEEMGGGLRLENHPQGGAVASLSLPLAVPASG